jgi:hypothetical protein
VFTQGNLDPWSPAGVPGALPPVSLHTSVSNVQRSFCLSVM